MACWNVDRVHPSTGGVRAGTGRRLCWLGEQAVVAAKSSQPRSDSLACPDAGLGGKEAWSAIRILYGTRTASLLVPIDREATTAAARPMDMSAAASISLFHARACNDANRSPTLVSKTVRCFNRAWIAFITSVSCNETCTRLVLWIRSPPTQTEHELLFSSQNGTWHGSTANACALHCTLAS